MSRIKLGIKTMKKRPDLLRLGGVSLPRIYPIPVSSLLMYMVLHQAQYPINNQVWRNYIVYLNRLREKECLFKQAPIDTGFIQVPNL